MKFLGGLISVVIVLTLSWAFEAFILLKLWGWFIATTFNVVSINFIGAFGMVLIIKYLLAPNTIINKQPSWDKIFHNLVILVILGCVVLLVGWLASTYIIS